MSKEVADYYKNHNLDDVVNVLLQEILLLIMQDLELLKILIRLRKLKMKELLQNKKKQRKNKNSI